MTVRVALVGCGTVARTGHLHGLRMSGVADVVAFASRSLASAERARDAWGSGEVTTDWASAVARDDVDAVHVCVPNALHADVAAAALQAGKHVLVEKPLTTSLEDAERLLALQQPGQLLGTGFDGRCSPVLQEARRRLPELGELQEVEVVFGHSGPQEWAPDATWFRDLPQSGGGCLLDLGVHVLDGVAWVAGPIAAVEEAELEGPVDEEARVVARLVGGARADLRVSWQLPEPTFSFSFTGTAGSLVVDGGELLRDGSPVEVPQGHAPRNAAEGFALAVATGGEPVADGQAGRAAVAAALAGYASARTGRPVELG